VRDRRAVGFAMVIASHGIGTSRALQTDELSGV
jgi:putative effector of murein hydrolase